MLLILGDSLTSQKSLDTKLEQVEDSYLDFEHEQEDLYQDFKHEQ
jgi:hypothetical protein